MGDMRVRGLHFYTLNFEEAVMGILTTLGMMPNLAVEAGAAAEAAEAAEAVAAVEAATAAAETVFTTAEAIALAV